MVFVNRASLRVLDVELGPYLKDINVTRRPAYTAALTTADNDTYSDANPITRNYAPLPWRTAYDALENAMKPLLSKEAPAVPGSVWGNHRLFHKHWAHLFINSDYPWREISTKDWTASSPLVITGFLYEYFLGSEYRRKVVIGPGGEIRHILLDSLPSELTEAITIPVDKSDEKTLVWWDSIVAPRLERDSDDVYIQRGIVAKLDQTLDNDITRIVKSIGKAAVSKLSTGRYSLDDPQYVASEVGKATLDLVAVSHLIIFYLILLFTHNSTGVQVEQGPHRRARSERHIGAVLQGRSSLSPACLHIC